MRSNGAPDVELCVLSQWALPKPEISKFHGYQTSINKEATTMSIQLQQYMDYAEDDESKFFDPWESVFEDMGGRTVLFCSSSYWGYGGSIDIDILLSDGRVLSYNYAFDSCCDRLEGSCDEDNNNPEIEEDVKQEATFFDDLVQYNAWVDTLPADGWGDFKEENVRKVFRREHPHE
jgi:hypothetical protein